MDISSFLELRSRLWKIVNRDVSKTDNLELGNSEKRSGPKELRLGLLADLAYRFLDTGIIMESVVPALRCCRPGSRRLRHSWLYTLLQGHRW